MRTKQHEADLRQWRDELAHLPCPFPLCNGAFPRPVDMVTCFRCRSIYNLTKRLGDRATFYAAA